MRMMSGELLRPLRLLCAWGLLFSTCPAWTAKLTLNFVDADGHPVEVTKAELLLVAWADTERIELETSANGLQLVLEPHWLRSRWRGFDNQDAVYLYLEAPPFAPIQSNKFRWPVITGYGIPTAIGFPGGEQVVVEDMDASLTLAFRPAAVRHVRIVTSRGNPLPEVAVDVYRFGSDFNRCAHLTGGEWLVAAVTDADGLIEVPEGDFEYVLSLGRYTHEFVDGDRRAPWRLRTHLQEAVTEVRAREFAVEPLEWRVFQGGKPAPGLHLFRHLASCLCGACYGLAGTADESGWIRVENHRPASYSRIWLEDDGEIVWDSARDAWPVGPEVHVRSAGGAAQGHRSP